MFHHNLKKYRNQKGLNQGELANSINNILGSKFTKDNVGKWEKNTNPKIEVIVAIAEILNIPEQYLFNDSEDVINKIVSNKMPDLKNIVEHTKKISLLDGYAGAGSLGIVNQTSSVVFIDKYIIKKKFRDSNIKGLTVIGDSMKPYVDTGDIVLFVPTNDYDQLTDGKYIISTMAGTQLKNLSFRSNGDILISSCNKAYPDELIKFEETQESIEINGIVVGRILMN